MKIVHFFILLWFILIAQSQRGGGRKIKASSRRTPDYDVRPMGSRDSDAQSSGTISNMKKKSKDKNKPKRQSSNPNYYSGSLGGVLVYWPQFLIALSLYIAYDFYKAKLKKEEEFNKLMKGIEYRFNKMENFHLVAGCPLSEKDKQSKRDWFTNKQWILTFRNRESSEGTIRTSIQINDFKKRSDLSYYFELNGSDRVGYCNFYGLLIHKRSSFYIYMIKVYNDKYTAGQVGQYQWLQYSADMFDGFFCGEWTYEGYQGHKKYSGHWQMKHY